MIFADQGPETSLSALPQSMHQVFDLLLPPPRVLQHLLAPPLLVFAAAQAQDSMPWEPATSPEVVLTATWAHNL